MEDNQTFLATRRRHSNWTFVAKTTVVPTGASMRHFAPGSGSSHGFALLGSPLVPVSHSIWECG